MDFSELFKERFSVRKFSDRPIPRETLENLREAGRVAPTAHPAMKPLSGLVEWL